MRETTPIKAEQSTPSSSGYVAVPEPDATPSQSFGSGGAVVLSSGLASSLGVPVGSTITSGTNCIYGSCLSLNGSQYVSIPYNTVFNFGSQMTAMVWVKGVAQGSQKAILAQYDYGSTPTHRAWQISTGLNSPFNQLEVFR